MTETRAPELVIRVRVLSVLLAGLLWLGVTLERPGELQLRLPVTLEHLPAGLALASSPPGALDATFSGPRVLLFRQWLCGAECVLDLAGAKAGEGSYRALDCSFRLDPELKLVRLQPQTIRLSLAKAPE